MKPLDAKNELDSVRSSALLSQIITILVVILCFYLTWCLVQAKHDQRIVQETPWGDDSRWISDNGVSVQKMTDMGLWMAHLTNDFNPKALEFNLKQLRTWTDPSTWAEQERRANATADRLKSLNATQMFFPSTVQVDSKNLRVAVSGELTTWIGTVATSSPAKTYLFNFARRSSRLLLLDWHETTPTDPFAESATSTAKGTSQVATKEASHAN